MAETLDTDLLRSFVAISETGSFTRAAEQVGRTQSAVSMQIKRLEEMVGHPLFAREGRRIELTREGEALLGYARRILKLNEDALAAVKTPAVEGTVRLGAPDEYATAFLPGILTGFSNSHPKVTVELTCATTLSLRPALAAGEIDLAIVTAYPENGDGQALLREPFIWAESARHLTSEEDPLPLALFQPGCILRRWAMDGLDRMGRAYRIRYSSPSLAGLSAAVKAGLAVTVLSQSTLPDGVRPIEQTSRLPSLPWNEIRLEHAPGAPSAAVDSMAAHIVAWFAAAPDATHATVDRPQLSRPRLSPVVGGGAG